MLIRKIISGGQSGADLAGLDAALELGLETGGWIPRGFRTENGDKPEYAEKYGLRETRDRVYKRRTLLNILNSDATVIFTPVFSAGSTYTMELCKELNKPWFDVMDFDTLDVVNFKVFLDREGGPILNVAGNRESKCLGIYDQVKSFLVEALGENDG